MSKNDETANNEVVVKRSLEPSCQNVSLSPKMLFGLKGDVKTNCFYLDDQNVIYPCGHNIVVFNIDERS